MSEKEKRIMTQELVKTQPTEKSPLVVFGHSPGEVAQGQKQIVPWCARKIQAEKELLADATENYEKAKAAKWQSSSWRRRVKLSEQRIDYYRKIKSALEDGYWLIPPMQADIFAIRTDRKRPTKGSTVWPGDHAQRGGKLPQGEGRHVSSRPLVLERSYQTAEGKTKTTQWAESFLPVDFPVTLVRPEIIDATQRAMALKVFDEIGILPQSGRSRGRDPIVVGTIRRPGAQSWEAGTTFFISWWLDYEAL